MKQVKMDLNDELRNFEQKAESWKNGENSMQCARRYLSRVGELDVLY